MSTTDLVESLRALVGSLPPGEALPNRRELCSRFNTNTFTFHKAISQLENEGLVTAVPRKGIFVSMPTSEQVSFLRAIYLDHPQFIREEFGLVSLTGAAARTKPSFSS